EEEGWPPGEWTAPKQCHDRCAEQAAIGFAGRLKKRVDEPFEVSVVGWLDLAMAVEVRRQRRKMQEALDRFIRRGLGPHERKEFGLSHASDVAVPLDFRRGAVERK